MVSDGEEGTRSKIFVAGTRLDRVFKYLGSVLDESSTDGVKSRRKRVRVVEERKLR